MNQTLSLADIHRDAASFDRKIRFRNLIEYMAAVVVVGAFGWRAYESRSVVEQAGSIAIVVAAAGVSMVLAKRGTNANAPPITAPTAEILAHRRAALDRQIRLLERAWLWYVSPFVPGLVLLAIDDFSKNGIVSSNLLANAVVVVVLVAVALVNRRGARKLHVERSAISEGDARDVR